MPTDEESRGARGRLLVVGVIVALLTSSAVVTSLYLVSVGTDKLVTQSIRFGLTVWLGYFLYRGSNWARLLVGMLTLISGLLFALIGLTLDLELDARVMPLGMGAIYLVCAIVLLFVPSVRAHFGRGDGAAVDELTP